MGSGSNFGTDVVQNLMGPFASRKPRQDTRQYQMTDPFQNMKPQQQVVEGMLANQPSAQGQVFNPGVGPRPEQTQSIEALQNYQRQAEPLYGASTGYLQNTVQGKYLDPMQQKPFQRLSDARQSMAKQMFADALTTMGASSAARGNYNSSAARAQQAREGGRIGTQAAQDIAQAGWTQYGRERDLQQQAAGMGIQLAPGLADKVFQNSEMLRSAEQQGNTAMLSARLQAAGLDQGQIQNILRYMQLASGQVLPSVVGDSPLDTNLKKLSTEAGAFSSVSSGMGKPGGMG